MECGDKLRNNMDAAEYKHVVLGLIFLKIHIRILSKNCIICFRAMEYAEFPEGQRTEISCRKMVFWVALRLARWD